MGRKKKLLAEHHKGIQQTSVSCPKKLHSELDWGYLADTPARVSLHLPMLPRKAGLRSTMSEYNTEEEANPAWGRGS